MLQIRWHGRGGQGVVTAARLLGRAAAVYGGKFAQSFPSFGTERRGAPVTAFTRLADGPLRDRSQIYRPDWVVVLDASLLGGGDIWQGLGPGGCALVNVPPPLKVSPPSDVNLYRLDAAGMAREILGTLLVNTAMVGALAGLTGWVNLEAVKRATADLLPAAAVEENWRLVEASFRWGEEVRKGRREK
ncbi:2-oxoacid:acceptor oxidoreductase family protein [Thermanaeromonas sp. C210]|uniref:2-oxoacid:acceptor oxidoreductase family protein n=1 Tax=Thermanaeromonas sp. C210 TaxID=2731925 RepID=UPI0015649E67|nr:2-oxoacid:acceptor oxidoreductase family protein [Thermanaeromonas sp. C210]